MSSSKSTTLFGCLYRDIADFPGYRIDERGTAWSCWGSGCNGRMTAIWRPLKGCPQKKGHLRVSLFRDGKQHGRLVHQLVLIAFVGPCPPGMECLHGDGDPTNNRLSNLKWGTHAENHADSVRHGTSRLMRGNGIGEDHPGAKLTQAQVERIVEIRTATGIGAWKICRAIGLPDRMRGAIANVITGKAWNHVTGLAPYKPKAATEA